MRLFSMSATRISHDAPTLTPSPDDLAPAPSNDPELTKEKVLRLETMLVEAEAATQSEHKLGLWQALKLYPKASAWSILISFAVVMEGFDVVLLGSFCS